MTANARENVPTRSGIDTVPNSSGSETDVLPGLLRHHQAPDGSVHNQKEAGHRSVHRSVAVHRRCLADVRECLAVQLQRLPSVPVLHETEGSVRMRN